MYTSQAPQSIISYHMTALYPSHDISFKMLHYNYYIKCRTSIWVLNTYLKGYIYIYLWKKNCMANHWSCSHWFGNGAISSFQGHLAIYRWTFSKGGSKRRSFYCIINTGLQSGEEFKWWSFRKRTQLVENQTWFNTWGVCLFLRPGQIYLWFLLRLVVSVAKPHFGLQRSSFIFRSMLICFLAKS